MTPDDFDNDGPEYYESDDARTIRELEGEVVRLGREFARQQARIDQLNAQSKETAREVVLLRADLTETERLMAELGELISRRTRQARVAAVVAWLAFAMSGLLLARSLMG